MKDNESVEVWAEVDGADLINHPEGRDPRDTSPYTRMDAGDLARKLQSSKTYTLEAWSNMELTVHRPVDFSGIVFRLFDFLEGAKDNAVVEEAEPGIRLFLEARPSLLSTRRPVLYALSTLALALIVATAVASTFSSLRKGTVSRLTSNRHVFISYKKEDGQAAEHVCAGLESQGISCWIAPRDILPGTRWTEAIVKGIEQSNNFVLLLSSHSSEDKQISREAELADRCSVPIITFRLEDVQPSTGLLYFLGNLQWLDAFGGRFDLAVAKLAHTITGHNDSRGRGPMDS